MVYGHAVFCEIIIFYLLKKWGVTVYNKYEEGKMNKELFEQIITQRNQENPLFIPYYALRFENQMQEINDNPE